MYQSSTSDVLYIPIVTPISTVSEHNSKWTKDHPLENIIGVYSKKQGLVGARGYRQEVGIDFEEVLRFQLQKDIEAIRIFCVCMPNMNMVVYQKGLQIRPAFLMEIYKKRFHVSQQDGFRGSSKLRLRVQAQRESSLWVENKLTFALWPYDIVVFIPDIQ
ncbi:hypothetical protein Tco_0704115 [Tanacetum coccineum]|uniref:Uncharacterized protein n=1 Tax=Tanacetum coccineum TaxID=301880 RepID=A0ABQ4Y0S9_9ASTR